jgi:hypothetical protein
MRQIEGNPDEAEVALRSVLQFLALEPEAQLALFQEPRECSTCRVACAYRDMLERYCRAPFYRYLSEAKSNALAELAETGRKASLLPNHCHEPQLLGGGLFADLRRQARLILDLFHWSADDPDPEFLAGRSEYSKKWNAEFERQKQERLAARGKGGTSIKFADTPQFDPRGMTLATFRERLSQVPWFSRLGERHALDQTVDRIKNWDDWGGPESDGTAPLAPELQRIEEVLYALPGPGRAEIESLRDSVEEQAFTAMPFGPLTDPWDGETYASLHGACVAATIAHCLRLAAPIPRNVLRQWAWFARGHWPCGYSEDDDLPREEDGQVLQDALDRARLVVF